MDAHLTDNKFYVPQIEEFHVGFEYERYQYPDKWEKDKIVEKDFCQMDDAWGNAFDEISSLIDGNNIRVKYLDHEDIVECGWVKEGKFYFAKNEHPNHRKVDENVFRLLFIESEMPKASKIKISYLIDGIRDVFSGTIRNKSELLVLMKQLNIK